MTEDEWNEQRKRAEAWDNLHRQRAAEARLTTPEMETQKRFLAGVAERHPEYRHLVRTIQSQMVTAERFPQSRALRMALSVNVERLRRLLGGR